MLYGMDSFLSMVNIQEWTLVVIVELRIRKIKVIYSTDMFLC